MLHVNSVMEIVVFNLCYSWIWKSFDISNWFEMFAIFYSNLLSFTYRADTKYIAIINLRTWNFSFSFKHISSLIICFHPYVIERISLLKIDTISGYLIEFKKIYGDECFFNTHDWIYRSNLLTKIHAFVQRCTFPFVNEIR